MGVLHDTALGGYIPICSNCGIRLCHSISLYEYLECKPFWDEWECKDCNPDTWGSLRKYKRDHNIDEFEFESPSV